MPSESRRVRERVRAPSSARRAQAPTRGSVRRHRGEHRQRVGRGRRGAAGEAGAEVGGLHRARSAAGGDHVRRRPRARPSRAASAYAGARASGVPAHHADEVPRVRSTRPARRRSRGRAAPRPACRRTVERPLRPGVGASVERCVGSRRRRRARRGSRGRSGRRRPAPPSSAGSTSPPSPSTLASRRPRTCNRGTAAPRTWHRRSASPRRCRSSRRSRQPRIERAPAPSRRSSSSRVSTSHEPAAAASTGANLVQNACAIRSPNSSCSSTSSSPLERNHVHTLVQSRSRKSRPPGCRPGRRPGAGR